MKPLLIFAADSECAATLRGFFERRKFHTSLGCGPIELDGIAFNPEQDIRVHPEHDPGMYTDPHTVLQAERKSFQYALLILDEAWEGSPPAAKILSDIEGLVQTRAYWDRPRFEVILIQPELEAWIWQRNPNVAEAFEFSGGDAELWRFLAAQALRLDKDKKKHRFIPANPLAQLSPAWSANKPKPENPKGLAEALSHHCQSGPASGIFNEISSTISVKGCKDLAFLRLRDTLRRWFPRRREAWEH